jgi:TP901 family phage tail tape measure protein
MDLLSSRMALGGAAVAAVGALMYKSGQAALSYEYVMAKVNATAQLTPDELSKLKNELMDIGEHSGGNFMRIPDAFEKINSQVNNVTRSVEILKVANKGAQAGFVDIDLAAGALAQTLSIVGARDNASGIMDMLLKAKAVGAGEFSDFATYLPQLIASGDNLSIKHQDVAGLFAFMTAKGQNAGDSAMLLQNAFTAMGKSDIQEKMAKQGIKLFDKDGNMRDLGVFFNELHKKLGKFSAEGKSNFLEAIGLKDAQAKNAFSVLAGDAEKLQEILNQVRNSTGELNTQLDKTANHTRTWGEIGDQIKRGMVGLGDYILPIVDKILQGASAWMNYFKGDHGKNYADVDVRKLKAEQAESGRIAEAVTKERVDSRLPHAFFENKGEKLMGKAKQVYDYTYNSEIAKRTGAFGGDYDKFIAEQKAKLAPKNPDKNKASPARRTRRKD